MGVVRPIWALAFRYGAVALIGGWLAIASGSAARAAGGVTGNLRGTVVDSQTQNPIAEARVTAVAGSGNYHTFTDSHGFFALLQLPTDTYTVGISKDGYVPQVIAGVTVLGDESQSVGVIKLLSSPRSLGKVHVSGHSVASAFQPTQTTDETTFVGARIDQALGERGSTNYDQLVMSAPGVIPTVNGSLNAISIRGSASVEIGYQFDGIDFSGNFFDENGDDSYLNGVGGGHGAMQVVSGAGDATQGGIGAGVVNIVPGRGSYPGDGFASFDVGGPWYDHSFAFQYGTATKDNRFSDFFSSRSDRVAPQIAPFGRDASDAGQYLGTSFTYDDDVLNNAFYKFGKNNDQEFQVLARFMDHRSWAEYGGLGNVNYYPYDPFSYQQFQTDPNGAAMWPECPPTPSPCGYPNNGTIDPGLAWYQSIIPYYAGVPQTYSKVAQPEEYIYGPEDVLKLGYTWNLNPTTSWNTFFYNWGGSYPNNITGAAQTLTTGSFFPGYNVVGGRRVGFQSQVTKQAGEKHTLTFVGKFENGFPYWNQMLYGNTWVGLYTGRLQDESNEATAGFPTGALPNGPRIEDWYLPEMPGLPVSAANPCIGPTIFNNFTQGADAGPGSCYLYSYMLAHGLWHGHLPIVPSTGFTYGSTDFQQYGIGVRDQWAASSKLLVDWGVRLDGQNLRWGANQFSKDLSNPSDVGLGYATLGNDYLRPQIIEPRIAADYILDSNNSLRASYGRSISFFFAQTAGTPTGAADIPQILFDIPAKDNPDYSSLGPACGSGWHGPGTNGNGKYYQNPWNYFSGSGTLGVPGWFFYCPNYAESLYWLFDQAFAAPDVGGSGPATYNNWDVAWSHQFHNGWGSKMTGYWRRGYNTYQVTLLNAGPPDPVTGQQNAGSFAVRETGVQKAFGIESMITSPTPQNGWSGFLTMNYINELTNTPPVAGSDSLPVVSQYLYETGTLFHQYYLPPFSAESGIQYKHGGWQFNPIFSFDSGVPFGVGQTAIGFVNDVLSQIPTGNLGVATPYAGPGLPNQSYNATCYVDPAFPGSYYDPRDFACRGYDEPALAGQAFTKARLYTDLNMQYTLRGVTLGAYVSNLFDNYRAEPTINNDWQPLATGYGGVQTGEYASGYPLTPNGSTNAFYYQGARDESQYDQYWLPYQELYEPGRTWRVYMQFAL